MFPDASEKNIILGFPQNDYHKYLPGMSRSWWRSSMGHSQQCSTGIDHRTFGNDQKHFVWTLPPFPPLFIECPFSVRKLKSLDQSRLRLRWKLKNSSLEKKSIFTPLYEKVDLGATFTPIQSSNLPTRGDGQVRSDQIYQYILPARCSFF